LEVEEQAETMANLVMVHQIVVGRVEVDSLQIRAGQHQVMEWLIQEEEEAVYPPMLTKVVSQATGVRAS
jgi:hypothetical protein